ncbi:hypothetical protein [Paraburkholderia tropica]|uniref:hypothetical protein n=1 Tax=Paraburkholderia tropica TaxID=92647 RepID=UPI002AB63018|nr:hypothetical protein [Paraburkholderia tropica]
MAIVVTAFGAIATAVTIAVSAYQAGKTNGSDAATAQCATNTVEIKSQLSKKDAALDIAQERIKALEQRYGELNNAYQNSQQTVLTQATQINTLTVGAKRGDVCEFFKSQVTDLQHRLDTWNLTDTDRAQITASKDAVIAKMGACTQG